MKKATTKAAKKKKGFTLIEILGVIIILGIVLYVLIPSVLNVIQNSRQKAYDQQIKKIEGAAELYVTKNNFDLDDEDTSEVTLRDLSDLGYITLPVNNPVTGEDFDPDATVVIMNRENTGSYTYTLSNKYGDKIEAYYDKLYGNWSTPSEITRVETYDYYPDGNYDLPRTVYKHETGTMLNSLDNDNDYQLIYLGTNTYNLASVSATNRWLGFVFAACGSTNSVYVGSFKILFNDDQLYTLQQAVANDYIEPLVIAASTYNENTYIWHGIDNLINDTNTDTINYSKGYIIFKTKDVAVKGFSFYSNKNFNATWDGFEVKQFSSGFDLGIVPF